MSAWGFAGLLAVGLAAGQHPPKLELNTLEDKELPAENIGCVLERKNGQVVFGWLADDATIRVDGALRTLKKLVGTRELTDEDQENRWQAGYQFHDEFQAGSLKVRDRLHGRRDLHGLRLEGSGHADSGERYRETVLRGFTRAMQRRLTPCARRLAWMPACRPPITPSAGAREPCNPWKRTRTPRSIACERRGHRCKARPQACWLAMHHWSAHLTGLSDAQANLLGAQAGATAGFARGASPVCRAAGTQGKTACTRCTRALAAATGAGRPCGPARAACRPGSSARAPDCAAFTGRFARPGPFCATCNRRLGAMQPPVGPAAASAEREPVGYPVARRVFPLTWPKTACYLDAVFTHLSSHHSKAPHGASRRKTPRGGPFA